MLLSCSGAPAASTCSVAPSSVQLNGSAPSPVTVAVTTAGNSANLVHPARLPRIDSRVAFWLAFFSLPGLAAVGSLGGRSRKRRGQLLYGLAFLYMLAISINMSACGGNAPGNGGGGTPAGTYNLTVTGTFTSGSTTLTHATKFTLVVK